MKNDIQKKSLLSQWKNREKAASVFSIPKAPEGAVIPLTSGQQRLWFLQQLLPDNPVYNYSENFVLKGVLSHEAFANSLQRVFNSHTIFKTTFHYENDRPVQFVNKEKEIELRIVDLSNFLPEERERRKSDILLSDAKDRFNLNEFPLVRSTLIKLNESEHVFLLTMHHIIFDKWSMDIFLKELASNYLSFVSGISVDSRGEGLEFADYALWQKNKELDAAQITYWKQKLSGEIPLLQLPIDYQLPPKPSYKGTSYRSKFPDDLSKRVLDMAKKMETTPYSLLLSVYYILLSKYSGQKDILVGSPISHRDNKVLEKMIGFFDETIVLRTEVNSEMSFSNFVDRVKKTTLEAFSNKDIPYELLVKELSPKRSLSVNPFFRVMFIYHAVSDVPSFGKELSLSHTFFNPGVSKFDLSLFVANENGTLSTGFEYSSDLFQEATIVQMQEHLEILLKAVTADPNQKIGAIPMLSDKEERFFLEQPKNSTPIFENYSGIHQIIEEIAEKYPTKKSVTFSNESITYSELNSRSNRVASMLLKRTKGENEIIALCIDRSIDMIIGLLGILKAGCGYLPIDPKYPAERRNFILNDANCSLILTQRELKGLFDLSDQPLLLIDEGEQEQNYKSIGLPDFQEQNIAYVIYTSGSTGNPKGVPVTHKNIINSTAGRLDFYPENPDAFLLMSSISFDSSKAGIFWTLCTGGNLIITEKQVEQDIYQIENLINEHSVTHTLMLPSLYRLVLEHGSASNLSSLKGVIVAGESCPPILCSTHFEKLPKVALYNEYGPTEATVWCTAHRMEKNDSSETVPIGRPVANAKIYLLNEDMNMVPFGATGEIYVGGPGVVAGYINRPELSNSVFIPNGFDGGHNGKLYRTGDLGKYRKDGTIEFLGRADHQVKIRGFRIELDEIEKIILEDESVNQVVAMVENSGPDEHYIEIEDFKDAKEALLKFQTRLEDSELQAILDSVESIKSGSRSRSYREKIEISK